jgi:hypothetical protein
VRTRPCAPRQWAHSDHFDSSHARRTLAKTPVVAVAVAAVSAIVAVAPLAGCGGAGGTAASAPAPARLSHAGSSIAISNFKLSPRR